MFAKALRILPGATQQRANLGHPHHLAMQPRIAKKCENNKRGCLTQTDIWIAATDTDHLQPGYNWVDPLRLKSFAGGRTRSGRSQSNNHVTFHIVALRVPCSV